MKLEIKLLEYRCDNCNFLTDTDEKIITVEDLQLSFKDTHFNKEDLHFCSIACFSEYLEKEIK
jgi:hypothetical protein